MPIEIALLGCAHPHVADVLGVIASEPDLRLAAAWDEDRSRVPGQVSAHAVPELETAIRRADAVIVCAPTDRRPALCVRAAQAGRPILVQQPLAMTAQEAAAAAREIARTRTPAFPALFLRQLPALRRLRDVLRAGVLGRLSYASVSYVDPGVLDRRRAGHAAWMLDPRRAGVGGLADLGIHLVDGLTTLGEAPVLDAARRDRAAAWSGDLGGAALGSWGAVPLSLQTSWAAGPPGLRFEIAGVNGTALLRDGALELHASDASMERWVGAPPDPGEAVRDFAARLRSRRPAPGRLADMIRAQAIIERAVGRS